MNHVSFVLKTVKNYCRKTYFHCQMAFIILSWLYSILRKQLIFFRDKYLGESSWASEANNSAVDDNAAIVWFIWLVKWRGWWVLVLWNSTSIDDISSSVWHLTMPTEFQTWERESVSSLSTVFSECWRYNNYRMNNLSCSTFMRYGLCAIWF